MKLSDKIKQILIEEKVKQTEFRLKTGISKTAFYAIKNGKTKKLATETAIKISSCYPKYSYKWLMTDTPDSISNKDGINEEEAMSTIENLFLHEEYLMTFPKFIKYIEGKEAIALNKYLKQKLKERLKEL